MFSTLLRSPGEARLERDGDARASDGARRGVDGELRGPVDVLLVCSAGGHLLELWSLRHAWAGHDRAWAVASHEHSDVTSLLADEPHTFCYSPTTRDLGNLARNTLLAWRLLGTLRPKVVLTTGAAVAVPFLWAARLRGVRAVYIESLARSERGSLSCRLVRRVVDRLYVQWPELATTLPGARYAGPVFPSR